MAILFRPVASGASDDLARPVHLMRALRDHLPHVCAHPRNRQGSSRQRLLQSMRRVHERLSDERHHLHDFGAHVDMSKVNPISRMDGCEPLVCGGVPAGGRSRGKPLRSTFPIKIPHVFRPMSASLVEGFFLGL